MFDVKPIKSTVKWPHEEIPKLPMRCIITAPSGGGKSTLVASMLQFPPYKKAFKTNVFVQSPTFASDPAYSKCNVDHRSEGRATELPGAASSRPQQSCHVVDHYDEQMLKDLLAEQKTQKLKDPKNLCHVLIIIDDLVCNLPAASRNFVTHLFFTARHYNISILLCTQSYKMVSRSIRTNATCHICLHVNKGEASKMADEAAASNFIDILQEATEEPYGFMVEMCDKPLEKRYRKKFTCDYLPAN